MSTILTATVVQSLQIPGVGLPLVGYIKRTFKKRFAAAHLATFIRTQLVQICGALGFVDQIGCRSGGRAEFVPILEDDRPVGVVLADGRGHGEPGRQLDVCRPR